MHRSFPGEEGEVTGRGEAKLQEQKTDWHVPSVKVQTGTVSLGNEVVQDHLSRNWMVQGQRIGG